ncbi:MAG: hypothetical protein ACYS0E_18785 [Planctomycetota bacterium]|jgi:hypothetical protein
MRPVVLFALLSMAWSADPAPPRGVSLRLADGSLVCELDQTRVYLVDGNKLRPFTGMAFQQLYAGYAGVTKVHRIPERSVGDPLADGTRLVRAHGQARVWFIENGKRKRPVSDLAVFKRYGFHWPRVQHVALEEIANLTIGPALH